MLHLTRTPLPPGFSYLFKSGDLVIRLLDILTDGSLVNLGDGVETSRDGCFFSYPLSCMAVHGGPCLAVGDVAAEAKFFCGTVAFEQCFFD